MLRAEAEIGECSNENGVKYCSISNLVLQQKNTNQIWNDCSAGERSNRSANYCYVKTCDIE